MPLTHTPLRYPGGKSALAPYLKGLLAVNDLQRGHYVEPYAGGAGLALGLLYTEFASEIHLNDLNPAIFNFWNIALNHSNELCSLINKVDVTIDEWHYQKEIYSQNVDVDPLAHAFATFFLNRTNRSGILTGGVIGGKEQTGRYKIDARYTKETLTKKLKKLASYKSQIHLYNQDAADFIINTLPALPQNSLTYFDPPYFVKGQNLYQNHYKHEDHQNIARLIQESQIYYWLVSYDNVPEIANLYSERASVTYNLSYSAQDHVQGSEIIIFSDYLGIPDLDDPANCRSEVRRWGYDRYCPPAAAV